MRPPPHLAVACPVAGWRGVISIPGPRGEGPAAAAAPSSSLPPFYPFTAPAIASMMWRWAKMKTAMMGASAMIEPAHSAVQLVEV